jgi:hypothetical protein
MSEVSLSQFQELVDRVSHLEFMNNDPLNRTFREQKLIDTIDTAVRERGTCHIHQRATRLRDEVAHLLNNQDYPGVGVQGTIRITRVGLVRETPRVNVWTNNAFGNLYSALQSGFDIQRNFSVIAELDPSLFQYLLYAFNNELPPRV